MGHCWQRSSAAIRIKLIIAPSTHLTSSSPVRVSSGVVYPSFCLRAMGSEGREWEGDGFIGTYVDVFPPVSSRASVRSIGFPATQPPRTQRPSSRACIRKKHCRTVGPVGHTKHRGLTNDGIDPGHRTRGGVISSKCLAAGVCLIRKRSIFVHEIGVSVRQYGTLVQTPKRHRRHRA